MKIKYNLLILLGIIILLSISSVNAVPIEEHNLTPSNQKIITSEHSKVHENTTQ